MKRQIFLNTTKQLKKPKIVDQELHEKIINFYDKDLVSRVLPYKSMTKVIKDQFGTKKRVLVRVVELTIKDAFNLFCEENQMSKFLNEHLRTIDQRPPA